MNIRQLEYFIAAAEEGSLSAAARRLGISQPPLGAQIKLLEEELSAELFERTGRGVSLTAAGRLLYRRAVSIVELARSAGELINSGETELMRLGVISSCGRALLEGRMSRYLELFPRVRFDLFEANTYQLLELVSSGALDAAVVRTPFKEEAFCCRYLESEPMAAVGRSAQLENGSISLQQLSSMPLIYYRRMEHLIENAFLTAGLQMRTLCKNDDARTCLQWAAAGLGTAVVPMGIVGSLPKGIYTAAIDESSLFTRIAAITRRENGLSPHVKAFMELF